MQFRTDLAIEMADETTKLPPKDYETQKTTEGGSTVFHTAIRTARAEKLLQKARGNYITVEVAPFSDSASELPAEAETVAKQIRRLLKTAEDDLVLVAGLGNLSITPDALGPKVISEVIATRHLAGEFRRVTGMPHIRPVAAIAPGVLGQTGIETSEIIACLCEKIRPAQVLIVDALAAKSLKRLGTTVQIADVGISPGSGAMNRRKELSQRTLGVPVISMGVPTVADGVTVGSDLLSVAGIEDEEAARQLFAPSGQSMLVTPKEIDLLISRASKVLAMAINRALQPELSQQDLAYLVN